MPADLNLTEAQQRRLLQVVSGACYVLIACYGGFILYLVSGFWTTPGWFYRTGIPAGADFIQLWAASSLALHGHPSLIYNPEILKTVETMLLGGSFKGYMACHLAPSFLLTILPMSFIPYLIALLAWLAIPLCGLMVIVSKIAPNPITLPLVLAFPAIPLNLFYGQGAFLITFLMGTGLLLLDSCPIISGILFSLILNYKPHLGLLILVALLAGRRWKSCGTIVAATASLVISSAWVMGIDTWTAYFNNITYISSVLKNESAIWDRMPTIFSLIRLQGGSVGLAMALQLAMAVGTIILLFLVWRRDYPLPVRGSVLVLGIFLCSPYAFEYDLTLLVLPLAWFAWEKFHKNCTIGDILLFALVWLSPVLSLYPVQVARFNPEPLVIALFMLVIIFRALKQAPGFEIGAKTITLE
jgi:hypothetical protein